MTTTTEESETVKARDYQIISADSHFTEPADLWLRYISPKYKDRAPHVEHKETTDIFVCDTGEMFNVGLIHGVRYKGGDVKHEGRYADVPASGWDALARIPEIERDGVYGEVLYPTIAMRFFTIKDVDFGTACVEAYNTWAGDFGQTYPRRFKAIGISFLDDIERAVGELHRMKKLGLAGTMIAIYPDEARPYHDPMYDPFWAAASELGLPVSLHIATERRVKAKPTPVERFFFYAEVQKVIVGMIYGGTFDKFPKLQVVSAENDASWAANLIQRMDYSQAVARGRNLRGPDLLNRELPSHYWHNNVSYTFMRDIAAVASRDIIGVERLLWSSDFPHGDSTWPNSAAVIEEHMRGVTLPEQRLILRGNAERLYGF